MSEAEAASRAEPRRLHPATLLARSLQIVPRMLAGGAGYAAIVRREGMEGVLLIALAAGAIGILVALLGWWRFRYVVRDSEMVVESGILHRQRRVIPFDRVQDVAIERRLIARLFGTARVKVETGAATSDEGSLDMIALDEAEALRDRIRRWNAGRAASGAAAAAGPEPEEPLLFAMGIGRVLGSGLFNFSLLFLALLFGALQQLDEIGLIEARSWFTDANAEAARGAVTLRAMLALAALLLALGLLSGVLRTLARDFGFRLTRTDVGFRRRRGLFTLSEVVVPLRRVQAAAIDSGPVARLLGWHALAFQTLGADRRQGGMETAAPFARMAEIAPILSEAGFALPPPRAAFHPLPRRALLRWAGQYAALAAVAAAIAFALDPRAGFAAAALGAIAAYGVLRWRRHGYALDGGTLYVRHGLLRRRMWILPVANTQAVTVSAGPLQRSLGLSTLLLDTAGAPLMKAPEIVDLDARDARALSAQLLELLRGRRAAGVQPA